MSQWSARPWFSVLVIVAFLLPLCPLVNLVFAQSSQGIYQGPLIDAHHHFHLTGSGHQGTWGSVSDAVAQMNQAGITMIVAFSTMDLNALKYHPELFIPSYQPITEKEHGFSPDDPRIVAELRRALEIGFMGLGEMSYRSSSARPPHNMSADNPAARQIVDLAAEKGAVINLHHEIGTKAFGPETIPEFERLLDYNKNVKFVWAHTGYGRPAPVAKLMAAHSNLYADLSTRTPGHPFSSYPGFIADRDGVISTEWKALFEKFPDRFMFGTDKGADVAFGPEELAVDYLIKEAAFFRKVLGQLSPDLAEKIAHGNIQNVMKVGQPTTLSISLDRASASISSPIRVSWELRTREIEPVIVL